MLDRPRPLSAVTALLGGVFLLTGVQKLAGSGGQIEEFERYGYPQWFRTVTGLLEVGGGAGLVLSLAVPALAIAGGAVTAVVMAGAVATHLVRVRDPPSEAIPALVLGLASAAVAGLRSRAATRDRGESG